MKFVLFVLLSGGLHTLGCVLETRRLHVLCIFNLQLKMKMM